MNRKNEKEPKVLKCGETKLNQKTMNSKKNKEPKVLKCGTTKIKQMK